MAFIKNNFSSSGANSVKGKGSQRFTYITADPAATVLASGYFDEVFSYFSSGREIIEILVVDDIDAPTANTNFITGYVKSVVAGVVDVDPVVII